MSKPRGIPSMTGFRGVAAVSVMLFDAQQGAGRISLLCGETIPCMGPPMGRRSCLE
jgi:peptidoglycan/LPS O-acetylase OafA/YrhL